MSILVAYFSASVGKVTEKMAEKLAKAVDGDLFEIKPETTYTEADLDWTNPESRSSKEMKDNPSFRPPIAEKIDNMDDYDTIFVGFPIWWYIAPTIINTFLESYDLSGKTIIPFASSGSSGMGNTNANLAPSCPDSKLIEGKRFPANVSEEDFAEWARSLDI